MDIWYWYLLGGVAAGILSSMFGIGAGVLVVPLLALVFGYGQKNAQGMALAIMVPMALVGATRYYLNPDIRFNLPIAGIMAVGGIIGALIGTRIVFGIPNHVLRRMFACYMIVVGINMFVKSFTGRPAEGVPRAEHQAE